MEVNVTRHIYELDKVVPLSSRESTLSEQLAGLREGKFSFHFTFSENFGVIFSSVICTDEISESETTTPYVLEEIKNKDGVVISESAFAYFQDKYRKPDDDAIYRVIARVITTDLLQEWTNKQAGTEQTFVEKVLPGCDWTKKTVLRFFEKGELDRSNTITDAILKK